MEPERIEQRQRIEPAEQIERIQRVTMVVSAVGLAVFVAVSIMLAVNFSPLSRLDAAAAEYFGATASDHPAWKTAWVVVGTVFNSSVIRVVALVAIIVKLIRSDTPRGSPDRMRQDRVLLFLAVSIIGGGIVPVVVKAIVRRPRPPEAVVVAAQSSFPSGHSFGIAVVVLAVLLLSRTALRGRWKVVALGAGVALVALVAFSRVALAVHYPSDVIAGVGLGLGWGGLTARICLFSRRPDTQPNSPPG